MINLLLFQSNTSEVTLLDRVDSVDSQDDSLGHSWNRNNSVSIVNVIKFQTLFSFCSWSRWLSDRVLDWRSRGCGFKPHRRWLSGVEFT